MNIKQANRILKRRQKLKSFKYLAVSIWSVLGKVSGFILGIASIYLAYIANNYSKTSVELAKNDSLQQAQLNLQHIQTDSIISMIRHLDLQNRLAEEQNLLTMEQNGEIRLQNNKIIKISEATIGQFNIAKGYLMKEIYDSTIHVNKDQQRLWKSFYQIMDSISIFQSKHLIKTMDTVYMRSDECRIRLLLFVRNLIKIVESKNENLYFKSHAKLYNFWNGFLKNLDNIKRRYDYYWEADEMYHSFKIIEDCFFTFKDFYSPFVYLKEIPDSLKNYSFPEF